MKIQANNVTVFLIPFYSKKDGLWWILQNNFGLSVAHAMMWKFTIQISGTHMVNFIYQFLVTCHPFSTDTINQQFNLNFKVSFSHFLWCELYYVFYWAKLTNFNNKFVVKSDFCSLVLLTQFVEHTEFIGNIISSLRKDITICAWDFV